MYQFWLKNRDFKNLILKIILIFDKFNHISLFNGEF